jgi:putative membrane protein
MGLYSFFHNQLTPWQAIIGAILFVVVTILITFLYMSKEALIDEKIDFVKAKIYQFFKRIGAIFVKQKY